MIPINYKAQHDSPLKSSALIAEEGPKILKKGSKESSKTN